MWRSHPIRFAALLGALAGFLNALLIEFGGFLHQNPGAVINWLMAASEPGSVNQSRLLQTPVLLAIEITANVLVFALLFAIPVSTVIGIRRLAGIRPSEEDPGELKERETTLSNKDTAP